MVHAGGSRPPGRAATSFLCWAVPLSLFVWGFLTDASSASAQNSDYCAKVRARAAGRAALLTAPELFSDLLRYPESYETGPSSMDTLQLRVGLSFSPTDAFKSTLLDDIGEADCRAHEAKVRVERALDSSSDTYRLPALRAQLEFLEQRRGAWHDLLTRAEQRLSARVITNLEFAAFSRQLEELERKLLQLRGETDGIRAEIGDDQVGPEALSRYEAEYVSATYEFERRESSQKSFDAWDFTLTGGFVPIASTGPDWFGWIQLRYKLGGAFADQHESDYLRARAEELRRSRYEVPARVQAMKRKFSVQREQAQKELALVDRQLEFLTRTRSALETADVALTAHARDSLAVEQMAAEAEQRFLRVLIETLTTIEGGEHG